MMFLNRTSESILCRSFPNFLDGAALLRFSSLPAGSVTNFDEFVELFINHFAASKIYVHNSDYISTIKQGQYESLKDYMTRFANIAMKIPNLSPDVHLHVLKSSLRPEKFQETIAVTKFKTLTEFRDKEARQIEIKELRQARMAERQTPRRDEDKHRRPNQT
ncbi:uncharacterized protein LOC107634019 [Arachis ipaensis]|uniref:uncharacterized protein LOC107634019 n=1 Tax=Arachis ipaensis TaxID=130454 RepID=UPI0007AF4AE8|nr:uncharacterized protein LOC107634019 [Arachis ipaensis]XP_025640956.1 uncharacterized protein LOC112735644 [Arachis hypogaea]